MKNKVSVYSLHEEFVQNYKKQLEKVKSSYINHGLSEKDAQKAVNKQLKDFEKKYGLNRKGTEAIVESIQNLSNQELSEDTISLSGGDDYDGCFTSEGELRFHYLTLELSARLINAGFINQILNV